MVWFKFNNLRLALGTKLKILHQSVKKVKTKSQKVLGANSYVCRTYRGKTGMGAFLPPIQNRVKQDVILESLSVSTLKILNFQAPISTVLFFLLLRNTVLLCKAYAFT